MARLLLLLSILLSFSTQAQPTVKWSFNTKDASFGQSASADIDGDGKLEIVFGCALCLLENGKIMLDLFVLRG